MYMRPPSFISGEKMRFSHNSTYDVSAFVRFIFYAISLFIRALRRNAINLNRYRAMNEPISSVFALALLSIVIVLSRVRIAIRIWLGSIFHNIGRPRRGFFGFYF